MLKEACSGKDELWAVINNFFWTSRSVHVNKQAKTITINKVTCRPETDLKTHIRQGTLLRNEATLDRLFEFLIITEKHINS